MFIIDNPGFPRIIRFAENGMKVSIYNDHKVRFYVSDYVTAAGKQYTKTLSGKFENSAKAYSFAAKICSMYKGKVDRKGNAKVKPLLETYRSFKGKNGLSRKEINNKVNAAVSNMPEHVFWSSDTILKEAKLQTSDKRYNDIAYGFISKLRNTPGIIPNIRIETLSKGNKFFTALDGQRKRPAKISRTIKI